MGRTFACSDLHGHWELFQKIKEFLQPDDTLYVLGDCADRGTEGWNIIKKVYHNPQMIYIKGNHEEILADAMDGDEYLCYINGGSLTLDGWMNDPIDPENPFWIDKLRKLPSELFYYNKQNQQVILCHSGYDINQDEPEEDDYIWDRTHFNEPWKESLPDSIMVHGHTPVTEMKHFTINSPKEEGFKLKPYWYCDGHKVNIDMGSFFTDAACLLDLDTWEEHMFYSDFYKEKSYD